MPFPDDPHAAATLATADLVAAYQADVATMKNPGAQSGRYMRLRDDLIAVWRFASQQHGMTAWDQFLDRLLAAHGVARP